MTKKRHIFLCGFMGCGKSTHGRKISKIMKMPFIDLDVYLQDKEKKTIQFIFENEGENEFRQLETKYLNEIITEHPPSVISLGGGTVCFNDNLETIKSAGILIYIEMPASALAERLRKSRQKRPLLKQVASDKLEQFISEKLDERNRFYLQAHVKVNGIDLNHLQLHHLILEHQK